MAIGERLREERKKLKMTQSGFAQVGGIGVSALKMYEGNEREPGALFLASVANAGADVQYIVTGMRSNTALAADEQVLLDGYRALDAATRRRMLAFMLAGISTEERKLPTSVTVKASGHSTQAAGRKIVNRGN